MSDVGLGANLELSIADALRRVDQLGAAIASASEVEVRADTSRLTPQIDAAVSAARGVVDITADAAPVSASVTAAVDQADTEVLVTGDARSVTGSIDGAVDAADTGVLVTGDASPVTSAVNGAIEAAQAEAHVEVEGSVAPGLQTDVLNLGANIADAADEGSRLGGVLAGLSVGAAAAGLFQLADAASEAEQSVGGVRAVFGESADVIDSFASQSAASAGIASTAARTLTAQIGGLLQGFDFTQAEAAETSVVLAQLGADLAATFGGAPEEAVNALGSALRGEFNPLERFGVSLNVAQINAFALERGMAASAEEVTLAVRAQAALALIMERTANAQGQFARESETAAGAIAIARAGAADLAAESGRNLTPALLELVDVVSRDVLPKLAEAGEDVLPAVSEAIVNLAPLLGVTTDLLVAAAPAIEAVADGLAAIPPEAITIGASLVVANRGLGILGATLSGLPAATRAVPGILTGIATAVPRATSGVGALAGGVTGLAQSVANLNPLTVGATVLAAGLFAEWQHAREEARRFAEEVQELEGALEQVDGRTQLTTAGVSRYIRELSSLSDQIEALNDVGITSDQVAQFAQRGVAGLQQFIDALIEAGDVTEVYRNEFGELVTANGRVIDANSSLARSLEDVGGRLLVGSTELATGYQDVAAATEEVARRQVAFLQSQGLVTEAQVKTALATNDSGVATRSYAEALNDLEPIVDASIAVQQRAQDEYDKLAGIYLNTAESARKLGDEAPGVNRAIADLSSGAVAGDRGFLNLALAIDQAALSEEGFADAAAVLGTDVETLQGFVDQATDSIDSFVESAASGLPTVSGVLGDVRSELQRSEEELARSQERDARTIEVSASQFAAGLREKAGEVAEFRENLDAITRAGFADVAGLLAEQGAEAGGALADQLVDNAGKANEAMLAELSLSGAAFQQETEATVAYMRDVLGPELILVSGLMGEGAAQALFEGIDFEERIRIQAALAESTLTEQGQVIAVVAATQGAEAARLFGENLQLDQATIDAGVAAGIAMEENAPTEASRRAGAKVGQEFAYGVADGLRFSQAYVDAEAERMVALAERAARDEAESDSPSKLFARIGADLAAGMGEGLSDESASVVAAAEAIVRDAATAVARVSPEVTAEVTGGAGVIGGTGAIPASLISALEQIAAQGPALSFGPIVGADARSALRDAVTEARALARKG